MNKLIFDSECFPNYYLLAFLDPDTNEVFKFERTAEKELDYDEVLRLVSSRLIITFNGISYDIPLLMLALLGATNERLKAGSDEIIKEGLKPWNARKKWGTNSSGFINHIDLFEVSPGVGSLKIYGGRLHSRVIQDLPYPENQALSVDEQRAVSDYCVNDVLTTNDLFNALKPNLQLRTVMSRQESVDLRSKSDAQIAEAVIRKRVFGIEKPPASKFTPGNEFQYSPPAHIDVRTEGAVKFLENAKNGFFTLLDSYYLSPPDGVEKAELIINGKKYRTGMGGLHSCEEKRTVEATKDVAIFDRDVTSYYPAMILGQKLFPESMGEKFLGVFGKIVEERVAAKRNDEKIKADALKIVVNGSFGKFGSRWSALFSPRLLIQTTLTGQLNLLMLIEMLEEDGYPVLSANTDGVTFQCKRSRIDRCRTLIGDWERITGLQTEEVEYASVHSRDVNSYIAIKTDGKVKTKGAFALDQLSKNPTNDICVMAAIEYLTKGRCPRDTIQSCDDIRKFVTVRAVKGGGVCGQQYLGKAVRWYYSVLSDATINYAANGNTVARSKGAMPLMTLPEKLPSDIDYDWYDNETWELLADMGVSL